MSLHLPDWFNFYFNHFDRRSSLKKGKLVRPKGPNGSVVPRRPVRVLSFKKRISKSDPNLVSPDDNFETNTYYNLDEDFQFKTSGSQLSLPFK